MKRAFFVVLILVALTTLAFSAVEAVERHAFNKKDTVEASRVLSVDPVAFSNYSEGSWYFTESGYVAAMAEELLDRAIFWAGFGNENEFINFIDSNPLVFPLRSGLRVYVEKFSFSGKVRIRPEGSSISVWTVREAIRFETPGNNL